MFTQQEIEIAAELLSWGLIGIISLLAISLLLASIFLALKAILPPIFEPMFRPILRRMRTKRRERDIEKLRLSIRHQLRQK